MLMTTQIYGIIVALMMVMLYVGMEFGCSHD